MITDRQNLIGREVRRKMYHIMEIIMDLWRK